MSKRSVFLALLVVVSVLAPVGVVLAAGPSDDLNYSGDTHAPNPYFDVDTLTVAKHPMSEGTSASAMAGYYDDSGNWVEDPVFVVNTTEDITTQSTLNRYTFDPAKIEDSDREQFPRADGEEGDNDASILDSSEWTTEQNSGNVTLSDTTLASNVPAVEIDADDGSNTNVVTEVAYGNWTSSFDSEESKRVIQVAGEVNSMGSGATVNLSLEDESGDAKSLIIDQSKSQGDNASLMYGQSSGTFTYQIKLSKLSTSGGGTWDNIESVNVTVKNGSADVSLSWLTFNKKGKTVLGKKNVDDTTDSDSDFDQVNTTYNATGTINVNAMDSLDADFDDATITDVDMPVKFPVSEMAGTEGEEDAYVVYWENASQYPNFDKILNVTYRMEMPAQIDLSYSGHDLQFEQGLPSGRYIDTGFAEDISDSKNLSQASLSSFEESLGSSGDIIDLDTSTSTDQNYGVHYEIKLTAPEVEAYKAASSGGGGGGGQFESGGSGGIFGFLLSVPGMIIGGFLTALGLRKAKGSGA